MDNQDVIHYELDLDDLNAVLSFSINNNTKVKRQQKFFRLFFIVLGIVMLVLAIIEVPIFKEGIALAIIAGIVGVYAILMGAFWFKIWQGMILKQLKRTFSRKPSTVVGKHQLSITSEGVTDNNEIGQTIIRWNGITNFGCNDQYLFMSVLGSNNYIVPKRVFPNEASFNQFVETAKSSYEKSKVK